MADTTEIKEEVTASAKFEDAKYLKQGDLKKIAEELGMNDRSVYRIFQGRANDDRVETVINELSKIRKQEVYSIAPRIAAEN